MKRKETNGNIRQYLKRSKERDEEAADERDLVSSLSEDLITEIFAKLPAKSIAKLISVSKLWSSIVRGKYFIDLFVSRSLARPSILFITFVTHSIRRFHTRSSGNRKTSITTNGISNLSTPVRGLICGQEINNDFAKVICNPSTGQIVTLPRFNTISRRHTTMEVKHFLGYDPINDVYKVLGMRIPYVPNVPVVAEDHQVFTLGAKKKAWKKIQCKHRHRPVTKGLCRDGVVYYGAWYKSNREGSLVVSFDLRSEDFGVIKLPKGVKVQRHYDTELVNYHEGIALLDYWHAKSSIDLWVLKDVKKKEWSKVSFLLPDIAWTWNHVFYCKGTISTGEIIFSPFRYPSPFFLVYYDLERNNIRRVDIEGVRETGDDGPTTVFMDHVESSMFLQKED